MEEKDFLWDFCKEHLAFCRHHEVQRETVTRIVIIVASALVGVITFDKTLNVYDLPLSIMVILIGVFGAIFSSKHYERFSFHLNRFRRFRSEITKNFPELNLTQLHTEADKESNLQFPVLSRHRLNQFWVLLHILIALIGVLLSIAALVK